MNVFSVAKRLSLATGLYRPARKINRILRPAVRRDYNDELRHYRELLPEGSLCFDIGANVGAKSEVLLEVGARVVAIEPNSRLFPELLTRFGGNPRWQLLASALSSENGIGELHINTASALSSFDDQWKGGGGFQDVQRVPIVTLDQVIESYGLPYYCKIDVEGWEHEVLSGLHTAISLISFEFNINKHILPRTQQSLLHLATLGRATVNVTPAQMSYFHLPEWMPLDEFIDFYPGNLAETLPRWACGDIYVKFDS